MDIFFVCVKLEPPKLTLFFFLQDSKLAQTEKKRFSNNLFYNRDSLELERSFGTTLKVWELLRLKVSAMFLHSIWTDCNMYIRMNNNDQYKQNICQSLSFTTKTDKNIAVFLRTDIRHKKGSFEFNFVTVAYSKQRYFFQPA